MELNGASCEPIVEDSEFLAIFSIVNVDVVGISEDPSKEIPKILTGFSNEEKKLLKNFFMRMIENMKEEE